MHRNTWRWAKSGFSCAYGVVTLFPHRTHTPTRTPLPCKHSSCRSNFHYLHILGTKKHNNGRGARCLDFFFCSCSQLVTVDQRFDFVEVFARAELLVVYIPIEQQWDDNFVQSTECGFAGIGLFTMSLLTVLVPDGMLRALIEIKQHRFCDSQ